MRAAREAEARREARRRRIVAVIGGLVVLGLVAAIQPGYVCSIGRVEVRQLMQRNPDAAINVLEAVAGRLHLAEEQLSSMSGLSVGERLSKHLLEGAAAAGAATFWLASTKKDLAAYLGTTAETLSRRLAVLQDRGLVRVGPGRTIEILDPAGLRAFRG